VGDVLGVDPTEIADVRATVDAGVSIQDFGVKAGLWHADDVAFAHYGRGVHNHREQTCRVFPVAEEREDAVVGVVGVEPFETVPVEINLVQGGLRCVKFVEVGDQALDAAMGIVLEQMPIEAPSFAPFVALGEFLAHEEEFLSGVRVVITEKKTEIRELPPEIARHFVKQRIFAVDDFVVREGKEEIFTEGVEKRERELVVLVLAVDGIGGEIFQRVIHPTHVPFEAETEPTEISGAGNAGPGSGFFGNGEDAGEPAVDDFVHALEESYGGEILPATEFVGNPFAGLAGIIHRIRWESIRRPCGNNRDRAWKQRRLPGGRRCGTCRARRERWR